MNGVAGLGDAYDGQDEAEVELAFRVQHSEPGDLTLLAELVAQYAGEVMRLAQALLTGAGSGLPPETVTQAVGTRVFAHAASHPDRFRGEVSLRIWMLKLTLHQAARAQREKRKLKLIPAEGSEAPRGTERSENWRSFDSQPENERIASMLHYLGDLQAQQVDETLVEGRAPGGDMAAAWAVFANLKDRSRIALILYYVCGLPVADLAEVLQIRVKQAHALLAAAWRKLLVEPHGSHRAEQIENYLSGQLVNDPTARDELESHLPECQTCSDYLGRLRRLDQQLREGFRQRWQPVFLSSKQAALIVDTAEAQLSTRRGWHLPSSALRKAAWTAGLLLMFATASYYMIRSQPQEAEFAPRSTSTATQPSMVVAPDANPRGAANSSSPGMLNSLRMFTYGMAGNGQNMALLSTDYGSEGQEYAGPSQQVFLYDKGEAALLEIAQSQDERIAEINWVNSPPSMSADGRFVAYSLLAAEDELATACRFDFGQPCTDIFVYDRQTATIQQITKGLGGAPANGSSFGPRLSADGRWVAFWSMASNLSESDSSPCDLRRDEEQHCMDLFLVDRLADAVVRIPVGSLLFQDSLGPDRISLSADGRIAAFTLQAGDELAEQLEIPSEREAVLYDQQSGAYELVNHNAQNQPGEAGSFSPVVSADGRYVAFASLSANLVPGDTNGAVDVFLQDRQAGTIERLSINAQGEQGNGDSGVLLEGVGLYSIDISGDGRYVVFLTLAGNLGTTAVCDVDNGTCNQVILVDRQWGTSEVIQPTKPSSLFAFPQVSEDGRWVAYLDLTMACTGYQAACLEVVLYDRQRGWYQPMMKTLFTTPESTWQKDEAIATANKNVELLAVAENGQYLAAAYHDKTIGIWDFEQEIWSRTLTVTSDGMLSSLAVSPDGTTLAAGSVDGIVHVWEIATGRHLYALEGHAGRVHTVLFSRDGGELLAGTQKEISVWRRGEGNIQRVNVLEYPSNINAMALAPSGNLLAVASSDHTVWLQLLPSGTVLTSLGGQESAVVDVAFSRDGSRLASRAITGDLNLWAIDWQGFGALGASFLGSLNDSQLFGNLAFSPNDQYLVSGSMYAGALLWDIDRNQFTYLYSLKQGDSIIKSVAFDAEGRLLLAGTFGAKIITWVDANVAKAPRYLQPYSALDFNQRVANDYQPMEDWPEVLAGSGQAGTPPDLYQLSEQVSFEMLVPTRLPEQARLVEARLLADGGVALSYRLEDAGGVSAELVILEHPAFSGDLPLPVGEQAKVEVMALGSEYAEYVHGDWTLKDDGSGAVQWQWDEVQPVQRLRWQRGISLEVFYRQPPAARPSESASASEAVGFRAVDLGLDRADLLQIASGIETLTADPLSVYLMVPYTIQAGDTCSGIAERFSTTTELLASLNGLAGDCSLIIAGQELTVPIYTTRVELEQADLDCDGVAERIQVLPELSTYPDKRTLSVFVQRMSDIGLFQDAWKLAAGGEQAELFSYPQYFALGECNHFLAFQDLQEDVPQLRIYHWADGEMQLVLDQGSKLAQVRSDQYWLEVLEYVSDAQSGACQVWHVSYEWHGEFVNVHRHHAPNESCP